MTTVLMPLDPSVSPQQAARLLSIRADLLPPEIREGRRARRTRAFVIASLVLVLVLLGTWYTLAANDRKAAQTESSEALAQLTTVQRKQQGDRRVQGLIKVESGTTLLQKELAAVLRNDLSWASLLDLIRDTGTDKEVTVGEISASLTEGLGAPDGMVGTMTITGTAANKKVVAGYVDALSALTKKKKGVSNPFVTSISTVDKRVSFSITLTITDKALCGRLVEKSHACTDGTD